MFFSCSSLFISLKVYIRNSDRKKVMSATCETMRNSAITKQGITRHAKVYLVMFYKFRVKKYI